jgi:hypothetical protein
MKEIVSSINIGFGNCVFLNRKPQTIEGIISGKINDPKIVVLPIRPKSIKVETLDDLHDKLSLLYDDGKDVEGTITWRKSADGQHFVFSKFE